MAKRKAVEQRQRPRGAKGLTGARGPTGARGRTGAKGPTGDPGPNASPDYILWVDQQFRELRENLHVQLVRTGQLQAELDRHHKELRETREQLNQVHALLQRYAKSAVTQTAQPQDKRQS